LPPVDSGKVTQIIQYEAQQNVPFPLAEVVWDYQILGSTPGGEMEVLLVAVKSEIVERLFRMTDSVNLRLQLTDVSPAALCNSFRYSYGDLEGCTMLLDIGAKTSNLLFFEKGKVYSRSINLGANSITQDFASEMKLPFDSADQIKIEEGFVSLGGAYEEPENPNQAAISKIARQFMTRLHIQVNQTLQFYRGQQAGSAPDRLFLCGGASVMPYTAQFFAEKLNVPVEYFNPLRNIQIDPAVDLKALAKVAHILGEVVGLGLRNLAHCPVELNLMPESTLRWQSFNQKKPYFIATVGSLVAVVFAVGLLFGRSASVKRDELETVKQETEPMKAAEQRFKRSYRDLEATSERLAKFESWTAGRFYWVDVASELQRTLIQVEEAGRRKYGVEVGLWIERFTSLESRDSSALFRNGMSQYDDPSGGGYGGMPGGTPGGRYDSIAAVEYDGMGGGRYDSLAPVEYDGMAGGRYDSMPGGAYDSMPGGAYDGAPGEAYGGVYGSEPGGAYDGMPGGMIDPNTGLPMGGGAAGQPVIDPMTGQPVIDPNTGLPMMAPASGAADSRQITVICRAVSLTAIEPGANTALAFAFENALRASELFDSQATSLQGQIGDDEPDGTYTFPVNVVLKQPLEL